MTVFNNNIDNINTSNGKTWYTTLIVFVSCGTNIFEICAQCTVSQLYDILCNFCFSV